MEHYIQKIEKILLPIGRYLATIKFLVALRDGAIYALPFLIVGSIILLLLNLPITDPNTFLYSKWYIDLMAKYKANWVQPFSVSMGIASLFISFGFGSSLAKQYDTPEIPGGFLSMFTFLLLSAPVSGWPPSISAAYMDGKGIFAALCSGVIAVSIYKYCIKYKLTIRLPEGVPANIFKSFEAIVPVVIIIILLQPLNIFLAGTEAKVFPEVMMRIFTPLLNASDTIWAILFIVFLVHILWFAGIHGANVVAAIVGTITFANLSLNQEALQLGQELPKIFAGGFLDNYVYIGGSGATIGLAIAMAISKNSHFRAIGRVSVVPGIFNINEPIIFGSPIVMNPILGIPFILVPLINTTIAYNVVKYFGISKVVALVPWTTPAPIAAFLSSNASFGALLLCFFLMALATIMYLPFLKVYEKSLLVKEAESVNK